MALDRQSIEKKDFPVGRRGYEPEAVDAHLSALADEIAAFQGSARRSDTLASSASEQVRAIIEAAETSAADIQRAAEDEARQIREDAAREAVTKREQAAVDAREYVDRVSGATHTLLERLEAMETEFSTLMEALRTAANRLSADLQLLAGNLTDVPAVAPPSSSVESVAEAEAQPAAAVKAVDPTEPVAVGGAGHPSGGDTAPQKVGSEAADDSEGARLIALNMALNGTPREEADRYLSENFKLNDRDGLLDEVYAKVDG